MQAYTIPLFKTKIHCFPLHELQEDLHLLLKTLIVRSVKTEFLLTLTNTELDGLLVMREGEKFFFQIVT